MAKKTVLLRIPMHCEVAEVVKYVDLSFLTQNCPPSDCSMKRQAKVGKVHDILLMIDLGDLREGIFFQNQELIYEAVEEILKMENVNLYGIGVNLTCYGAIIPKNENLSQLVAIARDLEAKIRHQTGNGIRRKFQPLSIWWTKESCRKASTTCVWGNPSFGETIRPTRQSCREQSVTD